MSVKQPSPLHWTIHPYRQGDEESIAALFNTVFNKTMSADQWLWKFKGRGAQYENVWLVKVGDQLVGHYGAMPGKLQIAGSARHHLVGADGMVHPAFRRQGIWTALVRHAHNDWEKAGVSIVFGLPNAQWGSRKKALGWQMLFPLKYLNFPIHPERDYLSRIIPGTIRIPSIFSDFWYGYHKRKFQPKNDIAIELLTEPTNSLNTLWRRVNAQPFHGAARDEAWLRWRFFSHESPSYTFVLGRKKNIPAGYLAFRIRKVRSRTIYQIADLLAVDADKDVLASLCFHTIAQARARDAVSVITTAIPGSSRYAAYRQFGFVPGRRHFNVMAAPLDPEIAPMIIQNQAEFHLTGGDFDLV